VTLFHIGFRSAALVVYLLCTWFTDSFITSFVFVVLLLSADFWVVKNISGRILAGLRWWNYIDEEGKSIWIYESREKSQMARHNAREVRIFWMALVLVPVIWGLFFLVALFGLRFKWLLLVLIALSLSGANLHGYIKCKFGANKDMKEVAGEFSRGIFFREAANLIRKNAQPPVVASNSTGIV